MLLLGLSFLVYWPAFRNGFISDDYVILQRAATLPGDPLSLFRIPPECFRTTSYLAFGLLKWFFGYHSAFFYVFAILLHWLNSVLLFKLLSSISKEKSVPILAAVFFAVFQGPSEATMWLTGMHESLLGISLLGCLLLWIKKRYSWCVLLYAVALFSKESAAVLLALIPLADYWIEKRPVFRAGYIWLVVLTMGYLALFLASFSGNSFVANGLYKFGFKAAAVFLTRLHHLAFPWLYLAILLLLLVRKLRNCTDMFYGIAWMALALLPYVFLTYQNHVPSRQEHLAAMGLAAALALMMENLRGSFLRPTFILLFVGGNLTYFWFGKVPQYEQRASLSARLIEQMQSRRPGPLIILDYPENIWTAKEATRLVPGWRPDMISDDPNSCGECPRLRWNGKSYVRVGS